MHLPTRTIAISPALPDSDLRHAARCGLAVLAGATGPYLLDGATYRPAADLDWVTQYQSLRAATSSPFPTALRAARVLDIRLRTMKPPLEWAVYLPTSTIYISRALRGWDRYHAAVCGLFVLAGRTGPHRMAAPKREPAGQARHNVA